MILPGHQEGEMLQEGGPEGEVTGGGPEGEMLQEEVLKGCYRRGPEGEMLQEGGTKLLLFYSIYLLYFSFFSLPIKGGSHDSGLI